LNKNIQKRILSSVVFYGGGYFLWKKINNLTGRRLTIITYHRITKKPIEEITTALPYLFTRKDTFEQQINFLKQNYTIITFHDLKRLVDKNELPSNSLIITFDDGYEDFYTHAYPILKKHNVKAVLFVTVNMINGDRDRLFWWDKAYYYFYNISKKENARDDEWSRLTREFIRNPSRLFGNLNQYRTEDITSLLNAIQDRYKISDEALYDDNKMLNWDQIKEMQHLVEIGSHSCNHFNILHLNDKELTEELLISKEIITERTGTDTIAFSYPHGNTSQYIEGKLKQYGYKFAVTTKKGINRFNNRYSLKRINTWEMTGSINNTFSKEFYSLKLIGF
jgi:peptidoglycan/xylan/chitin deacetylase (PgdA/CDA1 family)